MKPFYEVLSARDELNITLLDTETTGLNAEEHEAIGVAMLCLRVNVKTGQVVETVASTVQWREPASMDAEIEDLVGVTRAELRGRSFDMPVVDRIVGASDLIVAHSAAFDRRFLEPVIPTLIDRPWACSLTDIQWFHKEKQARASLAHLLSLHDYAMEATTMEGDCRAMAFLLEKPLPRTPCTGFQKLIEVADTITLQCMVPDGGWHERVDLALADVGLEGSPAIWRVDCVDWDEADFIREQLLDLVASNRDLAGLRIAYQDARVRFSDRGPVYFEP